MTIQVVPESTGSTMPFGEHQNRTEDARYTRLSVVGDCVAESALRVKASLRGLRLESGAKRDQHVAERFPEIRRPSQIDLGIGVV